MKRSKIKYNEIIDYNLIEENYRTICKNTKHKDKIIKYDMFHSTNINSIYTTLKNKNYKHGRYNVFLIKDPKYRIVMSENIKDKVINHVISNKVLKPTIYPKLIDENVATRTGKGTDAAIKLCKKYFIRMNNKYNKFYILKFDITKYFYNIDHQILKNELKKIYDDKDILNILYEIIDSTDNLYINDEIKKYINIEIEKLKHLNTIEANLRIKEIKKIPYYTKGKGLGIGSLSNQIFAIFYLNSLDHYIKENLKLSEYVRFMDDGIIFSHDKNQLKKAKKIIEEKLTDLNLQLNEKTKIYTSIEGFDFVGYRFKSKNKKLIIRIKNNTKNKMKKKLNVLKKYDEERYTRVKASYKGMILYTTCNSLYKKYFSK